MTKWSRLFLAVTLLAVLWPQAAAAQNKPAPAPAADDDPDRDPNRNQPDFTIVNLPTTGVRLLRERRSCIRRRSKVGWRRQSPDAGFGETGLLAAGAGGRVVAGDGDAGHAAGEDDLVVDDALEVELGAAVHAEFGEPGQHDEPRRPPRRLLRQRLDHHLRADAQRIAHGHRDHRSRRGWGGLDLLRLPR